MNILFLDRDGTLIREPEDYQVDSLEKLEILPGLISSLLKLNSRFRFVMITNQDGLGTDSFPLPDFEIVQEKLLRLLANEAIYFDAILVCPHGPEDHCECRKPKTKLILDYLYTNDIQLDKVNSYVVGDRDTDQQLAQKLGTGFIRIDQNDPQSWKRATVELLKNRRAEINRSTSETTIAIKLNIDGEGNRQINTGIAFFDHMLEQIAVHGGIDLEIEANGDLEVDAHHLIEDVAICLGTTLRKALGNKHGIERYGYVLPMDEAEAKITIDISNRFSFDFSADFKRNDINGFPSEMVCHFFKSLAEEMKINLHMSVSGENDHHQIEALFKGFARCLRQAIRQESVQVPSSKEYL